MNPKRIELVAQPRGAGFMYATLEVDLDKLSPVARLLAELVTTTDRRDDASVVTIETVKTWVEMKREACESRAEIEAARSMMGDLADRGLRERFMWPARICRDGVPTETGEHFFERCARLLHSGGWRVIDHRVQAAPAATEAA